MAPSFLFVLAPFLFGTALQDPVPHDGSGPTITAGLTEQAPVIDGHLDDPIWQTANTIDYLTESEPVEGRRSAPGTRIMIARDEHALYIGVECMEPEPDKMVMQRMNRDSYLREDDRIQFVFDTFHDGKSAYFFQMSAAGSRGDALIGDNGNRFNKRWDTFWEGRTQILEDRWTVEIAIPFRAISFGEGDTWGFNVQRSRGVDRSESRWTAFERKFSMFTMSQAGLLKGMGGLPSESSFEVVPFLKTRYSRFGNPNSSDFSADFGGEVNWRITPQLKASFTVNTDFAETESDQQRVNLTRFSLFFPEKRDFFLEDSSLFDFGEAGGWRGGGLMQPYYSRRIGLTSGGNEVPINYGARLSGRVGRWNLGLLAVHTGAMGSVGVPEGEMLVARPSYRVTDRLTIGALLTSGNPESDNTNLVTGLDARYSQSDFFGKRLEMNLFGIRSSDGDIPSAAGSGVGGAFGFESGLSSSDWNLHLKTYGSQTNFDPALGFVLRPGERYHLMRASWEPRPSDSSSAIRKYKFALRPKWWTDTKGDLSSHGWDMTFFGAEWHDGDEVNFTWAWDGDNLDDEFEPSDGSTIAPGNYNWHKLEAEYRFSSSRPLSGGLAVQTGGWYDGTGTSIRADIDWRPNANLRMGLSAYQGQFQLPGGDFTSRQGRVNFDWSFSPDFIIQNLIQTDNESGHVGFQSRTRWMLEDGRETFFVVNYGWDEAPGGYLIPGDRDISLKFVYSLRF